MNVSANFSAPKDAQKPFQRVKLMASSTEKNKDFSAFEFREDDMYPCERFSSKNPKDLHSSEDLEFFRTMFGKKHDKNNNFATCEDESLMSNTSLQSKDAAEISNSAQGQMSADLKDINANAGEEVSSSDHSKDTTNTNLEHLPNANDGFSEDEGVFAENASADDFMASPSEDKVNQESFNSGASEERSYSSQASDEDVDSEFAERETSICPDIGYYGGIGFIMPELRFSMESVKLVIKNEKPSHEEIHVFHWTVSDIMYIKTYQLSNINVTKMIIGLQDHCGSEMGRVFGESGESCLLFLLNATRWQEQFCHMISLNGKFGDLWLALDEEDVLDELSRFKLSMGKRELEGNCQSIIRFEETVEEFVFPPGDPDAVSISGRDIELLHQDAFINDTLVDFYIKYLQTTMPESQRQRCHFFNSFFFRKLADLDKFPDTTVISSDAFRRVRKWTRKVDIFKKNYIFIPVNYGYHWSVVVICNAGAIISENSQAISPCILHMDSLVGTHKNLGKLIQSYLWEEWRGRNTLNDTDADAISKRFYSISYFSCELPQQENGCDCGLFLLHYVERFLKEAPERFDVSKLQMSSRFLTKRWFSSAEASILKRVNIRELIYKLYNNQLSTSGMHSGLVVNELCKGKETTFGTVQEAECVTKQQLSDQMFAGNNAVTGNDTNQSSAFHIDGGSKLVTLYEKCVPAAAAAEAFEQSFATCVPYKAPDSKPNFEFVGESLFSQTFGPQQWQTGLMQIDENPDKKSKVVQHELVNPVQPQCCLNTNVYSESEVPENSLNDLCVPRSKVLNKDLGVSGTNEPIRLDVHAIAPEILTTKCMLDSNDTLTCSKALRLERKDDLGESPSKKMKVIDTRGSYQQPTLKEEIEKVAIQSQASETCQGSQNIPSQDMSECLGGKSIENVKENSDNQDCLVSGENSEFHVRTCFDNMVDTEMKDADDGSSELCQAEQQFPNNTSDNHDADCLCQTSEFMPKTNTGETNGLDSSNECNENVGGMERNEDKISITEENEKVQLPNDVYGENKQIIEGYQSPQAATKSCSSQKTPKSSIRSRSTGKMTDNPIQRPRTRSVTRNTSHMRVTRESRRRSLYLCRKL